MCDHLGEQENDGDGGGIVEEIRLKSGVRARHDALNPRMPSGV
jgi:hypothetical protein